MLALGIELVFLKKEAIKKDVMFSPTFLSQSWDKVNLCPRRIQDFHFVTQRSFREERVQGQYVRMPKTNQPQTVFWQLYWCEATH